MVDIWPVGMVFVGSVGNTMLFNIFHKVIALVLYPQIYASPLSGIVLSDAKSESIDEAKERFSKATGLKVFTLGDYGDMEELVTSVISFFSE